MRGGGCARGALEGGLEGEVEGEREGEVEKVSEDEVVGERVAVAESSE